MPMCTTCQWDKRIVLFALAMGVLSATKASAAPCDLTQVSYCTWAGDDSGFSNFGESGSTISFQTLPDGSPSYGGAPITPAFNYVLQGALFSSALPNLFITGNTLGYGLTAYTSNILAHNSITAQLTNPERGVGVYVAGNKTLFAYDAQGTLITSVSYNSFGTIYFLGVKSNIPIARAVIDNGTNSITIGDFRMIHLPVPEPATAALLLLAAPLLLRRARRRLPASARHITRNG